MEGLGLDLVKESSVCIFKMVKEPSKTILNKFRIKLQFNNINNNNLTHL